MDYTAGLIPTIHHDRCYMLSSWVLLHPILLKSYTLNAHLLLIIRPYASKFIGHRRCLLTNTPIDHHCLPHNVVSGQHIPGVTYFATTRDAGRSQGPWSSWNLGAHCGDDPRAVRQNRAQLQSLLPGPVHWLRQVQGTEVVELKRNMRTAPIPINADAAFTRDTGCVLAVLTADCLPIVITDIHARVLGVAHAGWRGLAQGACNSWPHTCSAIRQLNSGRHGLGPPYGNLISRWARMSTTALHSKHHRTRSFSAI